MTYQRMPVLRLRAFEPGRMLGHMYLCTPASPSISDDSWARLTTANDVRDALQALDEAAEILVPLAAETAWQSDGTRALNGLILQLQRWARDLRQEVSHRLGEIESAGGQ